HRDAGLADVPDRLLVVLELLLLAGQAEPDLVDPVGRHVLDRADLQPEALHALAQLDQVVVLVAAARAGQVGRRGQDDLLAAHLLGEGEVFVGRPRGQPDPDPHALWHLVAPPVAFGRAYGISAGSAAGS